jgi:hypothetical protein
MGFLSKIIEGKMPNLSELFDIYIKNNMND